MKFCKKLIWLNPVLASWRVLFLIWGFFMPTLQYKTKFVRDDGGTVELRQRLAPTSTSTWARSRTMGGKLKSSFEYPLLSRLLFE